MFARQCLLRFVTVAWNGKPIYAKSECAYESEEDCNSNVSAGKVLNYAGVSVLTPAEMSASARRVLRFIDLGGHEKYLKTALYGMTCMVTTFQTCPSILIDCNAATSV